MVFLSVLNHISTPHSSLRFYKEQGRKCFKALAFLTSPVKTFSVIMVIRPGEVHDVFPRPCTAAEWNLGLSASSAFWGGFQLKSALGHPEHRLEVFLLDLANQEGYCL